MSKKVAIGIDLGTTNSCVGVVRNGRVEIIANDMGNRITPSYVAFTDEERLIGDGAKAQASWNPENTIFDAKRLIGRKYDDPDAQKKMDHWPFSIINEGGQSKYEIQYNGETKKLTPEEISSMVLIKMKEVAETFIGHTVTDAVITVPAYFNDSQRQATIDAGTIAGLNVLSIINEPTAAAIAYGVDKKLTQRRNILIYNLGGGTFDVVILAIENGKFEVLAVNGDTYLGGGDFDTRLMDHFTAEFKRKHKLNLTESSRAMGKLRKACERAKRNLSTSLKERVQIECLFQGVDFDSSISRVRFEELCADLFKGTMTPVESVLCDSGLGKSDIHEVVLAGGSTRIPKIQELLKEFFQDKILNKTINPDEAVAYGAAVHAGILSGENSMDEILLLDIAPLSLGIAVLGKTTSKIIARNTKIPTKNTKNYSTVYDNQGEVEIDVYEGERSMTVHNNQLGKFILGGIQLNKRGVPQIEVTFKIDSNGILTASAKDASTGSQKSITITSNKGRLKKEDIKRMVAEAKGYEEDDIEKKQQNIARNNLEAFCMNMKTAVEDKRDSGVISDQVFESIQEYCDEALEWLENHPQAAKEEYDAKKIEVENLCATIISSFN